MAQLGNTIINGACRILNGLNVNTINGVTVGSSPKFTDTTYNFSGTSFVSGNSSTGNHDANSITTNGNYFWTSNGPSTSIGAAFTNGALYVQSYDSTWVAQIAQDYRNGNLFVRGKNNGTWTSWLRVLTTDDANNVALLSTDEL